MKQSRLQRLQSFITNDHRYVYLGGSVLAFLGLNLLYTAPNTYSYLTAGSPLTLVLEIIFWLYLAVSALALLVKLTHWRTYETTVCKRPAVVTASRYLSYVMAAALAVTALDRVILGFAALMAACGSAGSIPQEFLPGMIYMTINGRSLLLSGIWTTIRLALFGTAIAFVLSILMVFCRIQTPDKRDHDFVKFWKVVASKFASLYIFIVRGTPMMVQSLIIYYFGFGLFRDHTTMSVTEINNYWSLFISGLVTISLNSTAYLAEVLRGGINGIDAGQTEAARSLGMTNWQAMMKVVFPQAVKNSIPAIGNEFIINIKDSVVLSVIGVMDLMGSTKSIAGIYYRALDIYCVAALLYLILTYLSSLLLQYISKRMDATSQGIPSSN
jgi:putative lysine transport system permease protein